MNETNRVVIEVHDPEVISLPIRDVMQTLKDIKDVLEKIADGLEQRNHLLEQANALSAKDMELRIRAYAEIEDTTDQIKRTEKALEDQVPHLTAGGPCGCSVQSRVEGPHHAVGCALFRSRLDQGIPDPPDYKGYNITGANCQCSVDSAEKGYDHHPFCSKFGDPF